MNIIAPIKWLFKPRVHDDAAAIRNSKLAKETGDYVFRVAQMWIVLSIVRFASLENPLWLPLFWFLSLVLVAYALFAPRAFVLEWELGRGRGVATLSWRSVVLLLVLLVYAAAPLLGIVDAVDAIRAVTAR